MRIRKATPCDIPTVIHIARHTWPLAYKDILSDDQLEYMLTKFYNVPELENQFSRGYSFILAEDESTNAAGFAVYSPQEKDTQVFHLHKIYVLPEFQNLKVGKMLLQYISEDILVMGARVLQLNVNRYNKARFFYEKNGFRIIESVDIPIEQGYFMNDYIMEKKLF